jgi:hypothetical protein
MTEDGSRLGREPDIQYFRERNLEASAGSPEEIQRVDQSVLPQMVVELNRKVNGVIGKIGKLQEEIKRTAKDFIPVEARAYEVRNAIATLFPGESQDIITLAQYIEALEWSYRRTGMDLDKLITTITGNTEVDARIIEEMSWESADYVPPEELAIIAGQFLLVKMANRIMKPYNSKDAADVAAPKIYPGTERAPSTAQILIGLAALLLQIAENRDAVIGAIKKTVDDFAILGSDPNEIVAQAEAQGKDPEIEEWKQGQRPYLWDVLFRYVQDFLDNTVDTGYEGWQIYEAAEGFKDSMVSMEQEFDHYGRTVEEVTDAVAELSMDLYRMMLFSTADTNEQTDLAATILSSRRLYHTLCCLVIFGGAIPTKHVKLLRFALSLRAEGLSVNLGAALSTARNRVNGFLAERVLEPVLHRIDRFFHSHAKDLLELVDRNNWEDKELYDIMMACTPVDQAIEYGIQGLEKLKSMLVEQLMKVWRRVELKSVKGNWSWRLMSDSKRCREILAVFDAIHKAIERGNLCAREGGNTPSVEEIEEFVNRFSVNLPTPIAVETEGDPYEVFTIQPFASSTGLMIPEVDEDMGSGSMDNQETGAKRFRVEDCLRRSANPQEILKSLGLSIQLDRDLRDARNIDRSRPNS